MLANVIHEWQYSGINLDLSLDFIFYIAVYIRPAKKMTFL